MNHLKITKNYNEVQYTKYILNIKKGLSEKEVLGLSKKEKLVEKYIKGKEIKKIIFIQDKLINILINE